MNDIIVWCRIGTVSRWELNEFWKVDHIVNVLNANVNKNYISKFSYVPNIPCTTFKMVFNICVTSFLGRQNIHRLMMMILVMLKIIQMAVVVDLTQIFQRFLRLTSWITYLNHVWVLQDSNCGTMDVWRSRRWCSRIDWIAGKRNSKGCWVSRFCLSMININRVIRLLVLIFRLFELHRK